MSPSCFSPSYTEARQRFREEVIRLGAQLMSYPIVAESAEDLTIDVAIVGEPGHPTIVTSSGVHGVEGFFGSAVQLALLQRLGKQPRSSLIRYVFVHGVNPFGFSQLRRVNERNVDLNRNFIGNNDTYNGTPASYVKLNSLLNPQSAPRNFDLFKLKVLWNIARYGLRDLKQAVAGGQYEFPQGLFYGGADRSQSAQIIQQQCKGWIGDASKVVHVDLHTGLGRYADYKLLLTQYDTDGDWYERAFGSEYVEVGDAAQKTAYVVTGLMGDWLQQQFNRIDYRFVVAEFGTYNVTRVLQALRAENRAHHFCETGASAASAAKTELLECFCPRDKVWRRRVVDSALRIVQQSADALGASSKLH